MKTKIEAPIGDLHGDAAKVIYSLVQAGVIELDPDAVQHLRAIKDAPIADRSPEVHEELIGIVQKIKSKINDPEIIVLLGDCLSEAPGERKGPGF